MLRATQVGEMSGRLRKRGYDIVARQTKAQTHWSGSPVTVNIRIRLSQKTVWMTTGFLAGVWVASAPRLLGVADALWNGR